MFCEEDPTQDDKPKSDVKLNGGNPDFKTFTNIPHLNGLQQVIDSTNRAIDLTKQHLNALIEKCNENSVSYEYVRNAYTDIRANIEIVINFYQMKNNRDFVLNNILEDLINLDSFINLVLDTEFIKQTIEEGIKKLKCNEVHPHH